MSYVERKEVRPVEVTVRAYVCDRKGCDAESVYDMTLGTVPGWHFNHRDPLHFCPKCKAEVLKP